VIAHSRDRLLPGGEDYPSDEAALETEQERLARRLGLTPPQVKAVWRLCGARAAAMLEPAADDQADGGQNLDGALLPLRFVRRVIRREWVTCLNDLVERRLMLLYDPCLSVACLRRLAGLLAEQGLLSRGRIDMEVRHCADRLRRHYGKRLAG
jgi:glycerol-3-phosphate dehydrogenase